MDGIDATVRAGPPVNDLVTRAGNGDKQAWDTLVERYAPLIWSICRRHRLGDADAEDVGQSVRPAGSRGQLDPLVRAETVTAECIPCLRPTAGTRS